MVTVLIYSSVATKAFSDEELFSLLAKSRLNNQRDQLTGLLLYYDMGFMQVLEGAEAAVSETFQRIERDPRHRNILKIISFQSQDRTFTNWSMGFKRMSPTQMEEQLPGFTSYLRTGHIDNSESKKLPGKITAFLDAFRTVVRVA